MAFNLRSILAMLYVSFVEESLFFVVYLLLQFSNSPNCQEGIGES